MRLQEIFDLTLRSRSHEALPSTSCELCTCKVSSCYCQLFDPDLGVKVIGNVAQCPLHHVTYAHTKFEVITSKSLGGDAFILKYII